MPLLTREVKYIRGITFITHESNINLLAFCVFSLKRHFYLQRPTSKLSHCLTEALIDYCWIVILK